MSIRARFLFWTLMFSALPVFGDQFSFSYNFAMGHSILGTVEGDLQPDQNTVLHLHNLVATYSAEAGMSLTFTTSFFDVLKLNAVGIQFAGFENSTNGSLHSDFGFLFVDDGFPCSNCATVGNFDVGSSQISAPFGTSVREAEAINRSEWSAALVAVPEPGGMLLMSISLGAIGLLLPRRPV